MRNKRTDAKGCVDHCARRGMPPIGHLPLDTWTGEADAEISEQLAQKHQIARGEHRAEIFCLGAA